MQPHRQCLPCQRRERLCAAELIIQSYLPLLIFKHHHSPATPHHHRRCWRSCRTHENCMHAEQIIIIIFYMFIFIFCSMYLVLFSIVLCRTIVTVYTDNIFLYNYLRQMHQIIHLSPVGCFTPARGKTVQKHCEVSGVALQLIINSTMYTIVSLCVLFSNFGNINAVYMHFYPD